MAQSAAERIRRQYAAHAQSEAAAGEARSLAIQLGYEGRTLDQLPGDANLGLSCGNPVETAKVASGETVLDLGCGAGFDAFVAARAVGRSGRVVGLDMTPEMIERARANGEAWRQETGLDNVRFEVGTIEGLPFDDARFDVVISNCVLNLVGDQQRAYREIFRVLRPGGRLAVTDLALSRAIPAWMLRLLRPLIGCAEGLTGVARLRKRVADAGFVGVTVESRPGHVAAMASCQPGWRGRLLRLPGVGPLANLLVSVAISAERPADG